MIGQSVRGDYGYDSPYSDVDDDTQTAINESEGIFRCPNPKCIKMYTSYTHFSNHINGKNCVTRLRDKSASGAFVDLYIAKNGISSQHQTKSFREARKMQFHNKGLSPVDPIFKNCKTEELYEGWALDYKKKLAKITDRHKNFLRKIFNDGIKQKKKSKAIDVEMQMRYHQIDGEFMFQEDEWLTGMTICFLPIESSNLLECVHITIDFGWNVLYTGWYRKIETVFLSYELPCN